jgi:hypothetical protein
MRHEGAGGLPAGPAAVRIEVAGVRARLGQHTDQDEEEEGDEQFHDPNLRAAA